MDSAKNVLQSIVLATQQVRNATSRYSTIKGIRRVRQYSLIRLESEFQTIIDASRAILEILDSPRLCRQYMLDDRLVDWLSNAEPETCLDTLRKMERILHIRVGREAQAFPALASARATCEEDEINAAVVSFHAQKASFHFLLTTDVWNYKTQIFRKSVPSGIESEYVREHRQPQPTPSKNLAIGHHKKQIISQKLKRLLKFLDPLNCTGKQRETLSIRQSGTCTWLPAMDVYRSWREGTDPFLWLHGKPGAGKSVLASSVIDDLNSTIEDGEFLVYFYCDFRTRRSTSAVEVMRSILAQLTACLCAVVGDQEDLLDELLKESDSRPDPFYNVKGLAHYLSKVAGLCPQKPLVVVDALDECREVESLLDGLIMSSGDVRVFVTTRPLQNIISILSSFPCISMDKMANELSADILLHVTRELDSRHRLRTFDERLKEEIRSKLCARADGMFRWLQCQIDTLEKCASVSEIRRVLKSLPEGLEETYRRILFAIDRRLEDARLVRRALVWLVASQRPMRMCELLEGLAVDPIRRVLDSRFLLIKGADLLDVCRSLVVHDEETDIITLSHMSVKEYLVGELVYAKLPRYHIVVEDAHERLARLCMAYIAFCLDQMNDSRNRSSGSARERGIILSTSDASRPLLKYVLSDGFNHLAHLGSDNARIFEDMKTLQVWIRRYAWEWDQMCKLALSNRSGVPWPTSEHDFTFYTLIAFASGSLFQTILQRNTFMPKEGTNPLVYAAHLGKTGHAKALISRGANVNDPGLVIDCDGVMDSFDADAMQTDELDMGSAKDCKATALEVAVEHWHAEMVDLLLTQGSIAPDRLLAHVLRDQPHNFPFYIISRLLLTAEFVAWAVTPWQNQGLLEALIDDIDDNQEQEGGDGLIPVMKRLVEVGCAETLLLAAVEKGSIPVVRALMSMNTSSKFGNATSYTNEAAMNAVAVNGDTPLHIAMKLPDESGCLVITKLLVEAGCNPRGLDADDKPPVHNCAVRGFVSVADYLLSRNVPLPSRILFTALQTTLLKRVEMIRLLVSKGANACVVNSSGDTLLHAAVRSPDRSVCLMIAEMLIDAGCNPLIHNLRDETPIHIAAKQGYDEIVNYLLLFCAPSDAPSSLLHHLSSPETPLFRSLIGNTGGLLFRPEEEDRVFQAVRQFLDNQDQCLEMAKTFCIAGGFFGRSSGSAVLFDIAVSKEFGLVVEYLVSQNIPFPSGILFTALRCRPSMLPLLVVRGADTYVKNGNGDSFFDVAMSTLETDRARPTVRVSFDIHTCRKYLTLARALSSYAGSQVEGPPSPDLFLTVLQHGDHLMVRWLLDHGADVTQPAPDGDSLLHIAVRSSSLRTVQILIEAGCSPSVPNGDGNTPLHTAIDLVLDSIVDYLLPRFGPLPSDILSFAIQTRHKPSLEEPKRLSVVTSLIRNGANVQTRDANGNTLVHYAMRAISERMSLQATTILAEAGCSLFVANSEGTLPIEIAVSQAHVSVVAHLLERGSRFPPDIMLTAFSVRDKRCIQVLRMVSFLVEKGADTRALAANGDTALHLALAMQNKGLKVRDDRLSASRRRTPSYLLDIVKLLVSEGCDIYRCDAMGRTPMTIAIAEGHHEVRQYLEDLIAETTVNS